MASFNGRISLETGIFKPYSLEATLRNAKKIGYKSVELSSGGGRPRIGFPATSHFDPVGSTEKEVLAIKKLLTKFDIVAGSMFIGGRHLLASPDESVRKAAVADHKRTIKNARKVGCKLMTSEMTPGRLQLALSAPSEIEKCKKAWLKSVREILPDLERTDTYIAFEPHPGDFVEDSNDAVDLINEIDSERVGNLYCFPHTFNFTGKLEDMIKYAGRKLMHVHIADTYRPERIVAPCLVRASPELTLRFRREVHAHLVPGRGEIDFKSAIAALKQIDYRGYLSVQAFAHSDDPLGASAQALRYLEALTS
ncbi:MAG: sugar phosphate isomerase/epimerase [Thaumarchaeota archaeon]|nr:sugar phosphate isomerase/epimerase [Nitrososphaerota archaeon]